MSKDPTERIADALERIADALEKRPFLDAKERETAKTAGLSEGDITRAIVRYALRHAARSPSFLATHLPGKDS